MTTAKLNLTYEQFKACAEEFIVLSGRIDDGWELRRKKAPTERTETVFLVKNCTRVLVSDEQEHEEDGEALLEEAVDFEDEDDPAVLRSHQPTSNSPQPLTNEPLTRDPSITVHLEYHIVYSISYEVPVLYFNATYSNGRQLPLEIAWRLISDRFTTQKTDKWGLLTQQEHPLLGRPFYHIHPCHTAEAMGQATSLQQQEEEEKNSPLSHDASCVKERRGNYLVTWLSTFGPLVGLRLPLGYVKS